LKSESLIKILIIFNIIMIITNMALIIHLISEPKSEENEIEFETMDATYQFSGRNNTTGSGDQLRVDFILEYDFITKIKFYFVVQDDDPNTEDDFVNSIEIAEHDSDGEDFINYLNVIAGGYTTCIRYQTFEYSDEILIDNEWQLYFRVLLNDGITPATEQINSTIVPDTGFRYFVEIAYTYYLKNPYNNNI